MYTVLFADDEILTREAIAENVPWESVGFRLMGTAQNGKEAIALMKDGGPDLIITDICMPVMDGIELSAYVQSHFSNTKVVILSGYDEFQYAQQALKYGVVEYLLKPITSRELTDELLKIKEKIDKTYAERSLQERMRYAYEKSKPVVREHFLNRLLEGNVTKESLKEQRSFLDLEGMGNFQAVTFVEILDTTEFSRKYPRIPENLLQFAVFNITGELLEGEREVISFQNTNDVSIVIYTAHSEKELQERIQQMGKRICEELLRNMDIKVCIAVGRTVHSLEKWNCSYESAKHAREYKYLMEETDFLYDGILDASKNVTGKQRADAWAEKLLLLIKTNQGKKVEEEIEELFQELHNTRWEKQKAYLQIQNCLLSIQIKLEEEGIHVSDNEAMENQFMDQLYTYHRLSDVKKQFLEICLQMTKNIASKKENSNQTMAELALDYMNKNFGCAELSLNMVCEYLSVSVSYFSMLFKNYTGETFVEILTRIRMERAKKMLETTCMKNYEVATAVGYNDPHYFGAIFKKYTGMTPGAYAKYVK